MTLPQTKLAFVLGALLASGAAHADPTTATMQVTANVAKSCAISATAITLSDYSSLDPNATSTGTGTITVQCTKKMGYDLKIDDGGYASSGVRRMKNDAQSDYLEYGLFQDLDHQTPWNETSFVSGTGKGTTGIDHTVYAFVHAGQDVSVGTYNDAVKVTVSF